MPKISQLPAAFTPLSGSEEVPFVQSGVTVQTGATQIANTLSAINGTITGTYTLAGAPSITGPTISSPTVTGTAVLAGALSGTATGTYTLGGTATILSPTLISPILSGNVKFIQGSTAGYPSPATGYIGGDSNDGLTLGGHGSVGDVVLRNQNNAAAAYVPTGTLNFSVEGLLGIGMAPVNVLDITQTLNGTSQSNLLNASTAAAAQAQYQIANATDAAAFALTGTGFSGAPLSNGPTGEQAYVVVSAAIPLCFGTNNTFALMIDTSQRLLLGYTATQAGHQALQVNGGIFILTALTLNANSGNGFAQVSGSSTNGLTLQGKGSAYDAVLVNSTTVVAFGVSAGTTTVAAIGDLHVGGNLTVAGTGGSPFSKSFTSGVSAIPAAGSTVAFAHSLGAPPFGYSIFLQCSIANLGWSPGDIVQIAMLSGQSGNNIGMTAYADGTNVYTINGSNGGVDIVNKSSGGVSPITTNDWLFFVRAWI